MLGRTINWGLEWGEYMAWYWWTLIALAAVAFAILKIKVGKAFLLKQKEKREARLKLLEDDE